MISKQNLIDLLSKEDDSLDVQCHIDIKPSNDYKGDPLRSDGKAENVFNIKFTVFR